MDNLNNKKIYKLWSCIYDKFFGSKYINTQREIEISMLKLKDGDKILFVGVGTGEDLKFVPQGVRVTGIDITEEMLTVARNKVQSSGLIDVKILNMDGQNLEFSDSEFDYVVLNLILSVIPNGNKCLSEAYRVLKPEGKIAVFDKFLEENSKPGIIRSLLNKITMALGTDINRRFSDMLGQIGLDVIEERKSILGGTYKILILQKLNMTNQNLLDNKPTLR